MDEMGANVGDKERSIIADKDVIRALEVRDGVNEEAIRVEHLYALVALVAHIDIVCLINCESHWISQLSIQCSFGSERVEEGSVGGAEDLDAVVAVVGDEDETAGVCDDGGGAVELARLGPPALHPPHRQRGVLRPQISQEYSIVPEDLHAVVAEVRDVDFLMEVVHVEAPRGVPEFRQQIEVMEVVHPHFLATGHE